MPFLQIRFDDQKTFTVGLTQWVKPLLPEQTPTTVEVYGAWTWNGTELEASNDRYGICPLFYRVDAKSFSIATSLVDLISIEPNLTTDESAMAVFIRLGWMLAEDTPFNEIRALPPAAKLRWTPEKFSLTSGFSVIKPVKIGRDDARSAYSKLFSLAVSRRLHAGRSTAVTLSGGRDSRHILLEMCRQKIAPSVAITLRRYRPLETDDASIAKLLCKSLGIRHQIVNPVRSSAHNETRKNRITHFCTDENHWQMELGDKIGENGVEVSYDGLAGDVLSAGLFFTEERDRAFKQGRLADVARSILSGWAPGDFTVQPLLPEPFCTNLTFDLAVKRLITELERHQNAANPLASFVFWNRTRRGIGMGPLSIFSTLKCLHFPYLDFDVFDFLMSLPSELTADYQFHDETIQLAFPEHAHIPYGSGQPQPAKIDAIQSIANMAAYCAAKNPARLTTLMHWASALVARKPIGRIPRRRIHYLIQAEAELHLFRSTGDRKGDAPALSQPSPRSARVP